MPVYYGIKTVFIHIPKCAGSSMAQELFKKNEQIGGLSQEVDKHESAYTVANYMKYDLYLDFFKFGFVRNPYDRMVSWYFYYQDLWRNPKDNPCSHDCIQKFLDMPFNSWVKELRTFESGGCRTEIACPFHFIANQYQYLIWHDKRIFVDFIGRFESIQDDWAKVCEKINLESIDLPKSNITNHKNYKDYYDSKSIEIISDFYQSDINLFNYRY